MNKRDKTLIIIAPPKGSNSAILLNEPMYDNLAILITINKKISKIIGINMLFEKAAMTIIKIADINLILPSNLWIGLSCDASSSKLRAFVISAILFLYKFLLFMYVKNSIKR